MCVPVPDAIPTHRAVLAANMETALNLCWDAAPLAGERMLVIGAGVVGLLAASLLARVPATEVTVVDMNPARAALAERLGCAFASPEAAPADQELIVHASASEAGLRLALDRAAFEGRIVEASWYGDAAPAVPLGRSVSRAPPAADRDPGGCGRAGHARPAHVMPSGWRPPSPCWTIPPMTRCWRGRRGSRICRTRCLAFWRRAAYATSSRMRPERCTA